jgi:U3 small nucleolar RNA-associated protein 3
LCAFFCLVHCVTLSHQLKVHASRDRILLEGEEEYEDEDEDDDEVFALKELGASYSDDDDDEMAGDQDVGDDLSEPEEGTEVSLARRDRKNNRPKTKKGEKEEANEEESEDDESWGRKKSAYYASNMDQIESDDEEANDMEEQEARRIQRKGRDTLVEDDFGLSDIASHVDAHIEGSELEYVPPRAN